MLKLLKKVRVGGKLYRPGDTYEGKNEAELLSRGYAVLAEPKHLGGGWYLYPDGTKGRKAKCEEQSP